MNQKHEEFPVTVGANEPNIDGRWYVPLFLLAAFFLLWCVLFWSSIASMVNIWIVNDTFNHGFVILPISLWLIWRERLILQSLYPVPWFGGIYFLAALSGLWFVAGLVGIQAIQHLAIVSMIPALVLTLLGKNISRIIWFPLLFLLFAAPVGDFLVRPLMELTAWGTVELLLFTGFPVFREGMLFTIPSGVFEVEHACSGISYLIASVALGSVYAYINYTSLRRRALFILVSILVPLVANTLRAYGIVLLAHYSGYELAVGFDHLIYGGAFFGVVMLVLFWLGSFWHEDPVEQEKDASVPDKNSINAFAQTQKTTILLLIVLSFSALLIGPGINGVISMRLDNSVVKFETMLPSDRNGLKLMDEVSFEWFPKYLNAGKEERETYVFDGQYLSLYVAQYRHQQNGAELISSVNKLFDREKWRAIKKLTRQVNGPNQSLFEYKEIHLTNGRKNRLIVYWYQVADKSTVNPILVKLYKAWSTLKGNSETSIIAIAMDYDTDVVKVQQNMEKLVGYWIK